MVDLNSLKNDLQNIICGEIKDGKDELIKTTQAYLRKSFETSSGIEKKEYSRKQEEESLREYISDNNLWVSSDIFGTYITEGAEQKVYFTEGADDVIKISDAIFMLSGSIISTTY